jgi:hypothetical protein
LILGEAYFDRQCPIESGEGEESKRERQREIEKERISRTQVEPLGRKLAKFSAMFSQHILDAAQNE